MPSSGEASDHAQLLRAVEQFNAQEYYECHETLEGLWRGEAGPVRNLYLGILQVAVGLYHSRRGNLRGALRLLQSGSDLLLPFLPVHAGWDVRDLYHQAQRFQEDLKSKGTESVPLPLIRRYSPAGHTGLDAE